jgi:hypothetical protein
MPRRQPAVPFLLQIEPDEVEVLHNAEFESRLDSEDKVRFAVGFTLWLLGLADLEFPSSPQDELWDLLLEPPQRGELRRPADWLQGKWPGSTDAHFEVMRWARHVLEGHALRESYSEPGSVTYSELLAQWLHTEETLGRRRTGRPSQASGKGGTYARGGKRTGGTRVDRAMRRTSHREGFVGDEEDPRQRPVLPGREPDAPAD